MKFHYTVVMFSKIAALACFGLSVAGSCFGTAPSFRYQTDQGIHDVPFPDILENHSVFEDLQLLKKQGLLDIPGFYKRYPEEVGNGRYHRPAYRRLLAWVLTYSCRDAIALADSHDAIATSIATMKAGNQAANALALAGQYQKEFAGAETLGKPYAELFSVFKKDLAAIGQDAKELEHGTLNALYRLSHLQISRPGSALGQFSDVRPDHWAAKAVLELRREGILRGYPGENFSQP